MEFLIYQTLISSFRKRLAVSSITLYFKKEKLSLFGTLILAYVLTEDNCNLSPTWNTLVKGQMFLFNQFTFLNMSSILNIVQMNGFPNFQNVHYRLNKHAIVQMECYVCASLLQHCRDTTIEARCNECYNTNTQWSAPKCGWCKNKHIVIKSTVMFT